MMKRSRSLHSRQAGFALIEALIALLVMTFGMLALAGMQLSLSRSADIAKQRTEAMRLAQEQMETLRSYASFTAWNALTGGTNTAATNATYTRTWAFGGATTDTMRPVSVTVTWADRTNETQTVTLASVISQTDPADSGFLGFPLPQNTNLKRPKNRNINIPVPAIAVAPGKSAHQLAAGVTVVFSDISGSVIEKCTGTVDATSYLNNTAAMCPGVSPRRARPPSHRRCQPASTPPV
jgi:type IV pilus modification protein PilV